MRIDAVGVTAKNMERSVAFYEIIGFDFSNSDLSSGHVEPNTPPGSARLMIDTTDIVQDIIGEEPKPSNHSSFAIRYDSPDEVNQTAQRLQDKGFTLTKEPWDAFWNQRYAVAEDPDGYRVDLYADLKNGNN